MRFTIDVVYLDADDNVLKLATLPPFRFSNGGRKAKKVLELPAASIASSGLTTGEQLHVTHLPS
jgi:uncharacterized membrane protein (UPF0127 family)